MGKIPFCFLIPILPLVVLWASYYTCNIVKNIAKPMTKLLNFTDLTSGTVPSH